MSAQDADLVRAWQEARKGPQGVAEELKKVKVSAAEARDTAKQLIQVSTTEMATAISAAGVMRSAWLEIAAAIKAAIMAQSQYNRESGKARVTQDFAIASFVNQNAVSGIAPADLRNMAGQYANMGAIFGQKPAEAIQFATELASQGVDMRKEAPGFMGAAYGFAASQGIGLDMDTLKGFISTVRAHDPNLTATTANELARSFFGAYQTRQLQPRQLAQLSQSAVALNAAGFTIPEEFSANVAALDVTAGNAAQADTLLTAIVSRLRAPTPEGTQALAKLGLESTDADFVGERPGDVWSRIKKGFASLPAEQRTPAARDIFGLEHGALAQRMFENSETYFGTLRDIDRGKGVFDQSVQNMVNTDMVTLSRLEAQQELARAANGSANREIARQKVRTRTEQNNWRPFLRSTGETILDIAEGIGAEPTPAEYQRGRDRDMLDIRDVLSDLTRELRAINERSGKPQDVRVIEDQPARERLRAIPKLSPVGSN